MITKAQIKHLTSLHKKKFRKEHQQFVAEGDKLIKDLLLKMEVMQIFCLEDSALNGHANSEVIEAKDLKLLSNLNTPSKSIAIFEMPKIAPKGNGLNLVLDDIQDPGNLGTIIRIADWYNINQIICSIGTVDCYNAKVIQATMGSIANVSIEYVHLNEFLKDKQNIYGSLLNGENIHDANLPEEAYIMIGNEGNGISASIQELITNPITIPQFGGGESLNAAVATAVVCDNFLRS